MSATLNGWTAARLDDLAADVAGIHVTLEKMHSDEMQSLKADLKDARERPRRQLTAYLAPLIPSLLTILYLIISHG